MSNAGSYSGGGYFKGCAANAPGPIGVGANPVSISEAAAHIKNNLIAPIGGPIGLERQTVQLYEELDRLDQELHNLSSILYPLTHEQKSDYLANDEVPLQPAQSPVGQALYNATIRVGQFRKFVYQLKNSLEV